MGTGASKKEREAKKAAQAQYWKALTNTERLDEAKTIDSQGTRKLGDQLGGDMSARSKALSRQADSLARKLNQEQGDFNRSVGRFNARYDALQRQMKGENVTAYRVTSSPQTNPTDSLAMSLGRSQGYGGGAFGKNAADFDFIYDKDEALKKAGEASKKYQDSLTPTQKAMQQRGDFSGMGKEYLINGLNSGNRNPLAGTHLAAETMPAINESYRTLGATKQAFNDLDALAKQVGNTNFSNYSKKYEAIGEQLRQSIARDVRMGSTPTQSTGLLQSEVITGNQSPIDNEVIRL